MIIEFHSKTPLQYSNAPTYILYYANLDLVNVVSAGSSFIIIKLNAFESVVKREFYFSKYVCLAKCKSFTWKFCRNLNKLELMLAMEGRKGHNSVLLFYL